MPRTDKTTYETATMTKPMANKLKSEANDSALIFLSKPRYVNGGECESSVLVSGQKQQQKGNELRGRITTAVKNPPSVAVDTYHAS